MPPAEFICHPTWQKWHRVEQDVHTDNEENPEWRLPSEQKWDPS